MLTSEFRILTHIYNGTFVHNQLRPKNITHFQPLSIEAQFTEERPSWLPEAQLLFLSLLLPHHLHVAVLPHALPQFDWTAAHIFT